MIGEKQNAGLADRLALTETKDQTLIRWDIEAADLMKQGIYDWLCGQLQADRVLEIGCGFGYSTRVLQRSGKRVFALDNQLPCLEAARVKAPDAIYGLSDVRQIHPQLIADLADFAPQAMVIWSAGAPALDLPENVPDHLAVMAYRQAFHSAALQLATRVKSIQQVQIADRTAFPWQMKDAGRETMAQMLRAAVTKGTLFQVSADDVLFRKLDLPIAVGNKQLTEGNRLLPSGIVPVMGAAMLTRVTGNSSPI